jgi:hypothetical protein
LKNYLYEIKTPLIPEGLQGQILREESRSFPKVNGRKFRGISGCETINGNKPTSEIIGLRKYEQRLFKNLRQR